MLFPCAASSVQFILFDNPASPIQRRFVQVLGPINGRWHHHQTGIITKLLFLEGQRTSFFKAHQLSTENLLLYLCTKCTESWNCIHEACSNHTHTILTPKSYFCTRALKDTYNVLHNRTHTCSLTPIEQYVTSHGWRNAYGMFCWVYSGKPLGMQLFDLKISSVYCEQNKHIYLQSV